MEQSGNTLHCLNCGRSEQEVPLINLRYSSQTRWICSQCFPLLIHHPERLIGKLPRAEQLEAAAPDEH